MSRHVPLSVTIATRAITALVTLGGTAAVLVIVLVDDLVRSWAEGHSPEMRRILAEQGLEGVREASVRTPSFVMPAIVLFLVMAGLLWIMTVFFRHGHEWARYSIAVTVVLTVIATVAGIRTGPPVAFVAIAGVALAVSAVLLAALFHPGTTAFLRGRDSRPQTVEAPARR